MGCSNCGKSIDNSSHIVEVCEVCALVDNDHGQKEVEYCELCKAYICKHCVNDWPKRALAVAKKARLKIMNKL